MLTMNPEDLERLRHTFDNQADAVDSLRSTVQSGVDGTVWESPAAHDFRQVWESEFTPMLNNLREALRRAGQAVQNSHDKVVEANRSL